MKKIMLLSAVMGSLISINAFAHNIQPNQLLANVTVSDKGEITLNGNDVTYKSWSSTALPGKVRVIQHIAGRSAAKEKNQAMIEAIKAAHFNQPAPAGRLSVRQGGARPRRPVRSAGRHRSCR